MPKAKAKVIKTVKKTPSKRIKIDSLSVPNFTLAGQKSGTLVLPKEVFAKKINKNLLAQAARVYMANQKKFTASTKTRGEVKGTTAKMYRQKGTGRARHGAATAPIFVGGGIVFGPKPKEVRLDLPKKMKKAALLSALSERVSAGKVYGISGLDSVSGKTKQAAQFLQKIWTGSAQKEQGKEGKSTLIVTGDKMDNVVRAVRNIPNVDVLPVSLMNVYEVLRHEILLVTKDAAKKLSDKFHNQKLKILPDTKIDQKTKEKLERRKRS